MKKPFLIFMRRVGYAILLLIVLCIAFSGCNKDDTPDTISSEDSIYVVIDEIMNSWYLWYRNVPDVDIFSFETPPDLMNALMYKIIDKWSFVEEKEILEALFEEGESLGFGFLIRFDSENKLRVLYVFEKSEAFKQGLRKGHIVHSINGIQALLFQNYDSFFDENPATFLFEIIDFNDVHTEITLSKETVNQNGVFCTKIFDVLSSPTGYLAYNSFLGYSADELNEAFTYFKTNNVKELIIDLRYNYGGYMSLAEQMTEMIAPLSANGKPMYSRIHNDLVGPYEDTTRNFALHELNLNLNRVFFITTQSTASASELVINSLEPYMDVLLIGRATYGKPVGMYGFLFHDWYIYPVTTKLANADGYGDYFQGLPVDFQAAEGLDKDWGDETDPCLSQALYYIRYGSFNNKSEVLVESSTSCKATSEYFLKKNYLIMDR